MTQEIERRTEFLKEGEVSCHFFGSFRMARIDPALSGRLEQSDAACPSSENVGVPQKGHSVRLQREN